MQGIIIKQVSNYYTILSNNEKYICQARGKFKNDKVVPLVGDNVIFDQDKLILMEILPRKVELVRPKIANVDQAFIITSLKEPDLSLNLLDKLLTVVEHANVEAIICLTKKDLMTDKEFNEIQHIIEYYKQIGYTVVYNDEIDKIKELFKNKITVFTGQSGSGKSTLLNKLDSSLKIKTNIISKALNRGKHTTTHTELIMFGEALVADTPGFSAIDLSMMSNIEIENCFIEFSKYHHDCKYRGCIHRNIQGCNIVKEVENKNILESRYQNYLKFIR